MTYGNVDSWPELSHDEIIPAFLNAPPMTGPWGSRRNLRSPEALNAPFAVAPETLPADSSAPSALIDVWGEIPEEGPNDPDFRAEPDDEQIFVRVAKPGRRTPIPLEGLDRCKLTTEQSEIVAQWFASKETEPCVYYHQQVVEIAEALRQPPHCLSLKTIGSIFGISKGAVNSHLSERWSDRPAGRPRTLTDDQWEDIVSYVLLRNEARRPPSYSDIQIHILDTFDVSIAGDTLRNLIRRTDRLRVVDGKPVEEERVECDTTQIDAYYRNLEHILKDFPASLVINLDESGHQEWADRHIGKVVVASNHIGATIEVPISRKKKRATILGAITASGRHLRPLTIVPRGTIESELFQIGYPPYEFLYASQECGFITRDLFDWWADEVLFPYIKMTRERLQYDGPALVILDGCSCHGSDSFDQACMELGVELAFLPPHTSDQIQPLDLGIFAVQKIEASRTRPSPDLNPQTQQLVKILNGYTKACCPNNITSAFRRAGIVTYWSVEHKEILATVDRETATEVRHWRLAKDRITLRSAGRPAPLPITGEDGEGYEEEGGDYPPLG
jgi:hypothetical protein